MVRAGTLRHRVWLQAATLTKDALGGDVQTWANAVEVWAQVRPLSGREALEAQRISSTASAFITIRYRDDVTPAMRVAWRGRVFQINQVENAQSGDEALVLWCSEVQAQIGQVA